MMGECVWIPSRMIPARIAPSPETSTVRSAKTACLALACAALVVAAVDSAVQGDTLRLKSGLTYTGKVVGLNEVAVFNAFKAQANRRVPASCPIWMVDDGPRRLCVPGRQAAEVEDGNALLSKVVSFKFPQHKTSQSNFPSQIGTFSRVEEFDEFGHGMVQLRTREGLVDVILGIVELRPDYVQIESLSHDWSFARTTQSLGADTIERLLSRKVDRSRPEDRRALIAFYEQAELYKSARREVDLYAQDFPNDRELQAGIETRMDELDAERVLNELVRRRAAGQHQLVEESLKKFPLESVSAKIRRSVEQMGSEYTQARERRSHILLQLDMLQSELPEDQAANLRPLRSLMEEELSSMENLDRLAPYEQIAKDGQISASSKLALAYSSWVVGPSDAVESLPAAVRMWELRFLMLEYLRTPKDAARRMEIVKQLEATEGMSVERLARMVEFLPVFEDSAPIPPGVPTAVDFESDGAGEPLSYVKILPKAYSPEHTYPLLVVLHTAGADAEKEASWWAGDAEREGQAQRRGFITIAPRYAAPKQVHHEYDLASHRAVLGSIRHAMRTHRVDADRIVLAGHGMGADACFDLGMSHPDLFAGVAPICGKSMNYCKFYYANAMKMSWYVVAGQRDRDTVAENMRDLNRYFVKGADIIYCEFKERGLETYSEEQPRLMDWAETVRRKPITAYADFAVTTLRAFDNRFHWVQAGTLPQDMFEPIVWEDGKKQIPTRIIEGKITPGGTVYVKHPGKTCSVWFSPEMINFEERVRIRVNGHEEFNGSLKPSAEVLLEDLRTRSDRQRLFWARVDLK